MWLYIHHITQELAVAGSLDLYHHLMPELTNRQLGFKMGNLWVGFSHTHTCAHHNLQQVILSQPVNYVVSHETFSTFGTHGYFSLKYSKYSIICT